MCDFYADEVADIWRVREVRARKSYSCLCCRGSIAVGKQYQYTFTLFDGEVYQERLCLPCARVQKAFGEEHRYYPGGNELVESLQQCVDEGDDDSKRWRLMLYRIGARRRAAFQRSEVDG